MKRADAKVLVCLDLRWHYERSICRGAFRYVGTHACRWRIPLPGSYWQSEPEIDSDTTPPTGILGCLPDSKQIGPWRLVDIPMVNVSDSTEVPGAIRIVPDNQRAGELAAEHLLGLGLRRFVVVGRVSFRVTRHRMEGFRRRVEQAGQSVLTLDKDEASLERAIETIAPPVGLFGTDDQAALWAERCLTRRGLNVPEDVAILGANNDDLLCQVAQPALSSIDLNLERVGYVAAATLHQMLEGRRPKESTILIEPIGIVARGSTSQLAVDDPVVRQALEMIRRQGPSGLTTDQLLDRLSVSRRTLEQRFVAAIGRTPHAELQRVRFEQACRLLRESDLGMKQIAQRTGFANPQHFATAFHRRIGRTPSDYRARSRMLVSDNQ